MSGAIARAKSPVCVMRSCQSSLGPGLPWTKTTASLAFASPLTSTGDPTPSTATAIVARSFTLRRRFLGDFGLAGIVVRLERDELRPPVEAASPPIGGDQPAGFTQHLNAVGARSAQRRSGGSDHERRREHRRRLA